MRGVSGEIILLGELVQFNHIDEELLVSKINFLIESIEQQDLAFSFGNGLLGILWTLDYLNKELGICIEIDIKDLEENMLAYSVKKISEGYYDFLYGGTGGILYFLNKKEKNENIKVLLTALIQSAKIKTDNLLSWEFKQEDTSPTTKTIQYDTGIAHGVAGIMIQLALIFSYDKDAFFNCKKYVKNTFNWFKSIIIKDHNIEYIFPTRIEHNGN